MKKSGEPESNSKVIRHGRTIYFFDDVDEGSVLQAIQHLMQLQIESLKKPITFIINSGGGGCYDGLALYDAIMTCPVHVTTIGMGIVGSMAFLIYLAGDKRISAVNTRYLNHQVSSEISGKVTDIDIARAEMTALEDICTKIVAERTGMKESQIKKDIKVGDNYYSAEEALKKGIVHEIIAHMDKTAPNELTPDAKA